MNIQILSDHINNAKIRLSKLEDVLSNIDFKSSNYLPYSKEYKKLEKLIETYSNLLSIDTKIEELETLLKESTNENDQEMQDLIIQEKEDLNKKRIQYEYEITILLVPNENNHKGVILEIRPGTGGDEASIFVSDLYRMYVKYAEKKGWKIEVLSIQITEKMGCKEVILSIKGDNIYNHLKFEIGGHRVQRVPLTENQGRVHTSMVKVAIFHEIEEKEIEIRSEDLRIDVFRSSGPGGQSVNTTDSAVRITHIPTSIVVQCQDEKSQHKNKAKALRVLRARLHNQMELEKNENLSKLKKKQFGTGDRNDRVRTYNFSQNRVTDHRIGLNIYNKIDSILNGEMDLIIIKLMEKDILDQIKN